MNSISKTGIFALMVVLLGLYGCNQEQASDKKADAPKTETAEEATATETAESSEVAQTAEEVANNVVKEVEEVAEQAGEAVQEVTEQAGEVVKEVVNQAEETVSNVTQEASEASNEAAEATEEVVQEATETAEEATQEVAQATEEVSENTSVTAQNPEAILSAPETLQADTLEAARHDRRQSKIAYVGAWAGDANGCSLIDQGVYDGFAVITPNSIRMFEELCTIQGAPMNANSTVLEASCSAEGETNPSKIKIEMLNGENMKLAHEGTSGFELVRCWLPQ